MLGDITVQMLHHLRYYKSSYHCDGSKTLEWGPSKPLTFENWGPQNKTRAIRLELQIKLMSISTFQSRTVPHIFQVWAAFFKMSGNAAISRSRSITDITGTTGGITCAILSPDCN